MNEPVGIFFNSAGRLRSVWRFTVFGFAFLVAFVAFYLFVRFSMALVLSPAAHGRVYESNLEFVLQGVLILVVASLVGWLCGYALEDLPWRALGWALHRGWVRDLLLGSLLGAASLGVAVVIDVAVGGMRFASAPSHSLGLVAETLLTSAVVFVVGAAAEEALFRGYPLQTLMRSWPLWVAALPTSLLFALVHLDNPNVGSAFAFAVVNTALAGVWLAVAYARTRSLWFALGLHWSWNWTMGALFGLPVSGIRDLTPEPLLRAADHGPAWLTGGAYGPEGGAACTAALLLSTLLVWKTNMVAASEELKHFTDHENPRDAGTLSLTPPGASAFIETEDVHAAPRND